MRVPVLLGPGRAMPVLVSGQRCCGLGSEAEGLFEATYYKPFDMLFRVVRHASKRSRSIPIYTLLTC